MSFIQIINTFTFYGLDVSLLAAATGLLTQLIKKTLFKRAQKKLVTFLPFAIGIVLYAVYAAVRNLSAEYVLKEYVCVLEHGISVGAAATLYYILYEQFVRSDDGVSVTEKLIATLIGGYVPEESALEAAKAIAEAIRADVTGSGAMRAQEILKKYCNGSVSEREITLLSGLIIETLAHVTTQP